MNLQNFTTKTLRQYTSKLQLAKILNVSTKTLYQYHDTAMLIEDFEKDYPSFTNDSYAITKASLTQYQCWVIFSLISICRRLPHKEVKVCLLQDKNPDFTKKFSKSYYHYQEDLNNDVETICRVTQYAAS